MFVIGSGSNGVPHEVDGQQAAVMMQPSGNFSPVTTVPPVMAFRPENPGYLIITVLEMSFCKIIPKLLA